MLNKVVGYQGLIATNHFNGFSKKKAINLFGAVS